MNIYDYDQRHRNEDKSVSESAESNCAAVRTKRNQNSWSNRLQPQIASKIKNEDKLSKNKMFNTICVIDYFTTSCQNKTLNDD